jgi:hypothetical protein
MAVLRLSKRNIYDVIVYREGNVFYAEDGSSGKILYSSSDSEELLQRVLDAIRDNGIVYIRDVVYADMLISKKKVTLMGTGAIYTKTGKLVSLLGNIEVRDLEVDFYTPRLIKQPFIEQFTDPNLSKWSKYIPSDGSVRVYQETKTVGFATFVERGVVITGGSSDLTGIYKEFPLAYRRTRIIIQTVDLTAPSSGDKAIFLIGSPGTTRPFSGKLVLKINASGNLVVTYVNTNSTVTTIDTGVNIVSRPVIVVLDIDNKNRYAKIYVDGREFTITDWYIYSDLKYVVLVGDIGYTAKFNLVYVEPIEGNVIPASATGYPDPYHHPGISDSLSVYALGLKYPDGSTHIELRDLKTDTLIKAIDLDERLSIDGHEYVYTRFVVEGDKRYLYAILARHINNYTIYKIDTDSWNVVWKKMGPVSTYNKLIWGWITGIAVLYRDSSGGISIDHIDPNTGNVIKTDNIVSPSGYIVYGYFSPDWSGDGYLWIAWSNYDGSSGLRKNVYALAIDKNGVVYAPDGTRVSIPVSATDSKLLIDESDYTSVSIRPVREGAIVFRGGFYTPDKPSAFWLKKPGQVIRLELAEMPYIGAGSILFGRIPAIVMLTYVSRIVNNVLYNEMTYVSLVPVDIDRPYLISTIPHDNTRILVNVGSVLYIYRTGYKTHYDSEIVM